MSGESMAADPHQIELTEEQLRLLVELTSRTGRSPQDVLSDALRHYQPLGTNGGEPGARSETVYDVLERKGLIGCIKGGPADLSTNPTHMEGFGDRDQ